MTKTITIPNSDSDELIQVHLSATDRLGNSRSMTYYTLFSMDQLPALRDQLDEILGDREDYKALRRDHAIMAQALSENEAAARVLGIVEGDDFLLTIAQWAKSYRAPQPSPDLKEAISAALRSYRCRHSVYHDGKGKALAVLLSGEGKSVATGEEELDGLTAYLAGATMPALPPALTSEEAEAILGCAEAASAWAPSRTAEAARQLIVRARIARAAAERLSGVGAADDEPSEVAREQWERDTIVEGVASNKARLDKLKSLYLPGLDERVTRLEQHAGEAQHALGTDGGEIGLHRDQIGEITKRIEEIGLEIHGLQNWRRSCAHLPADAEALAALVDAAVEQAVEPIRNTADSAHRRTFELSDRVRHLELHRQGLTDGQAEAAVNGSPEDLDERLLAVYLEEVSDSPLSDEGRHHVLKMLRDVADAETLEAARGRLDGWVAASRQKMIAAKIWGAAGV